MKFYKFVNEAYYLDRIKDYNLTAIYRSSSSSIQFYKNGMLHNSKNAAYVYIGGYKRFYLNGKECKIFYKQFYLSGKKYGENNNFTKKSWRRFCKLQVFL